MVTVDLKETELRILRKMTLSLLWKHNPKKKNDDISMTMQA